MNEWRLTIKKVNNGFILKGVFGESDEETEYVLSEKLSGETVNDASQECVVEMLQMAKEYFACYYSKHKKTNVVVDIVETDSFSIN